MHAVDWSIVLVLLAALIGLAVYSRRYNRSVADFLAANRLAGRYVLTLSEGIAGLGAITIVAAFEMFYKGGFVPLWWNLMGSPLGLIIALSGFVIYRFRQTRALTMAQFFEIRYSRRFRVFCGMMMFLSGVINYGIFPGVTSRFFIHFCGLPDSVMLLGAAVPTFPLVMAIELIVALYLILGGGQIAVMVTDFLQAMFCLLAFLVIVLFMVATFQWPDIFAGLQTAEQGKSLVNPFQAGKVEDFNFWYFVIGAFTMLYVVKAWQGSSAFNSSARSPHEARMAGVLGIWRGQSQNLVMFLLPVCAYAILHNSKFAEIAQPITAALGQIPDATIRNQVTVPVTLTQILPIGLTGILAGVIVAAAISTDESYLHSWGTIFIQDVVMPIRNKALTPRHHMLLLRGAIIGVAAFGFVFSMVFPLKDYINMFFFLTGAIFVGGAGSVIIGGLYWKRGTTAAAWTAMIVGSVLSLGGLSVQTLWPGHLAPWLLDRWPDSAWLQAHAAKFPVNGQIISFIAICCAIALYVMVSLLGPRRVFDMDRMLHRGKHARPDDPAAPAGLKRGWRTLGAGPEFTFSDKIIYYGSMGWTLGWWTFFLIITGVALTVGLGDSFWQGFWQFKVWLGVVLAALTTVWFTWGGMRDMRRLFADLRVAARNVLDDGRVADHRNLADEAASVGPRQRRLPDSGQRAPESGRDRT